ncbi:uncharacterized protein C9orf50 homolog [Dipodomys spectabilis]|uniref:uncharacterized protein C9orf50 homolog n=1 Tax=Dipodomys spectabilis TaxID=105255 RepID=UPI001C543666|nr:uncharacterized protein C9orf50 homolog [Dipodomys spectabilis]
MARRAPGPPAQERGPRAGPWRTPLLPELVAPEPRGPPGAGGAWWRDRDPEPRAGGGRPAARSRLPPLRWAGGPRGSRSWSGEPWQPPDSLGGLLGELLPSKFQDFLRELQAKCADGAGPQREAGGGGGAGRGDAAGPPPRARRPGPPAPRGPARPAPPGAPGPRRRPRPARPDAPPPPPRLSAQTCGQGGAPAGSRSPQCPTCPFLPDLWHHPTHFHHLPPGHPHPQPALGRMTGDRLKKGNLLQGSQVPRINTVQIPSPGEGTAPRHRRYCPFRVRFEDETLRDSERRYWERNCAVHRNIFEEEPSTLPEGSVPERVLRNVGKWLESLPKAVYPRLKEAMGSSSSSWERTGVASTSRPRGDYKTFLDAYGTLGRRSPAPCSCTHKQEPFLPSLVLQSLLRRSRL